MWWLVLQLPSGTHFQIALLMPLSVCSFVKITKEKSHISFFKLPRLPVSLHLTYTWFLERRWYHQFSSRNSTVPLFSTLALVVLFLVLVLLWMLQISVIPPSLFPHPHPLSYFCLFSLYTFECLIKRCWGYWCYCWPCEYYLPRPCISKRWRYSLRHRHPFCWSSYSLGVQHFQYNNRRMNSFISCFFVLISTLGRCNNNSGSKFWRRCLKDCNSTWKRQNVQ